MLFRFDFIVLRIFIGQNWIAYSFFFCWFFTLHTHLHTHTKLTQQPKKKKKEKLRVPTVTLFWIRFAVRFIRHNLDSFLAFLLYKKKRLLATGATNWKKKGALFLFTLPFFFFSFPSLFFFTFFLPPHPPHLTLPLKKNLVFFSFFFWNPPLYIYI